MEESMNHYHSMPVPAKVSELKPWLLDAAARAGKISPADAEAWVKAALPKVTQDNLHTFVAGFTRDCPGCK